MLMAGLALLLYGLHKHQVLDPPPVLHYGERLSPIVILGENESTLTLETGFWYFLASGSHDDLRLAQYLSRLLDEAGLETGALRPIVVIDEDPERLVEFEFRNFLAFPLHALHSFRHEDLLELGFRNHDRAFALLSPDLEVVFASSYLKPNDLRLLLEKHLGMRRAQAVRPLEPGDPFPAVPVTRVAGPRPESEAPGGAPTWVIFTAECVTCSLRHQMELLAEHYPLLEHWAAARGTTITLLFSDAFDEPDLVEKLDYLELSHLPVYLAETPIYGFEDPYLRESLHGGDVLVAQVDGRGTVTRVEAFIPLVRSLDGTGAPRRSQQ